MAQEHYLSEYSTVKKDYKSRERGAITRMREDLELETLEERRLSLRLILMYKVVMSPLRYGFQVVAPYSMIDLTRVTYVAFRHVSGTFLIFLLRKPSVTLAFLHTLLNRRHHEDERRP
jgi:hypothetical protein